MKKVVITTAHPDSRSLTHHAAAAVQSALPDHVVDMAHLAQEGFRPEFSLADRSAYLRTGEPLDDVRREQLRLEQAQHLVLVFPVYWWSMPALLKGWVDRVFSNGWAFDYDNEGLRPRLQWLTIHFLPLASGDSEGFARHGYAEAFKTQLEHGIVDYCGGRRGVTEFIYQSESSDTLDVTARVSAAAARIGAHIRDARQERTISPGSK